MTETNHFDLGLTHKYLYFRRTKIIATIGPASASPGVIAKLLRLGLNVVRINFSHGAAEDHLRTIRTIRRLSRQLQLPVAILGDLCGPKIRVGRFRGDAVTLRERSTVTITTAPVLGDATLIPCRFPRLAAEVRVRDHILLDDGNIELMVTEKRRGLVRARVLRGGELRNNKGMNFPDTPLRIPALTVKDRQDVEYCIKGGVDYIALSFVRRAGDVLALKRLLKRRQAAIPVIAKIEKPEALQQVPAILMAADGIMIARGDLGVELPAKKVPVVQETLIEAALRHRKPVIVATQMLESMMEHSRPTRAEVTDVSAACAAGADAAMLSGETASGKHPVEALATMDAILRETESYRFFARGGLFRDPLPRPRPGVQEAVSAAIAQLSRDLMVRCIVVETRSGRTASVVSADRPSCPIIALTPSHAVFRRMHLLWGVVPRLVPAGRFTVEDSVRFASSLMKGLKLAKNGDFILLVRGIGDRPTDIQTISVHRIA